MRLYPYQKQVYELLSSGKSVVLQAPTGAGKTAAALYPFLRAWEYNDDFPRKCIYSVPLRVLADQFEEAYSKYVSNFGFRRPMTVGIQTGARPEDQKLEDNLIFTTVDQTLSNFLNIPYALSTSQGNLNAGAVLSSYLVFDELHLFDPQTMLPTTLHLLRLLKGIVPFLVMTATFSEEMVTALADQLDAKPIVLSAEEAADIPSQNKTRRMHIVNREISASAVLDKHEQRSVAICNTVNRAQTLFEKLHELAGPEIEIRLLHSRFLQSDREATEDWLRSEFGKEKDERTVKSAILVATQVVEVGLDITSEALHTELAPAASVIQRAGRCARYPGEVGDVHVYQLPLNKSGNPNYAPYFKEQKIICEKTRDALMERSGETFDFGAELMMVNEAHGEADQHILNQLQANRHYLIDRIAETIEAQERSAARELIRDVDSRTVFVHPQPRSIENPWTYEGFGIYKGSLFGSFDQLDRLADDLGEEWVMMSAEAIQEEESYQSPTLWRWWHIYDKESLKGALFVVLNPRLARYNPKTGFQLGVEGQSGWQSPQRDQRSKKRRFSPYQRETYQEHIKRMLQVYERTFFDKEEVCNRLALLEEIAYAAHHLEQRYGWPQGTLDRLAKAIITLHDVGKLDKRWQEWAHTWQEEVSQLREEDLSIPDNYMAAHTDYNGQAEVEQALNRELRSMKPNHAVESAQAVENLLWEHTGIESLVRASLSAIARHHSAGTSGSYGDFKGHPAAPVTLAEIADDFDPTHVQWHFSAGSLARKLIRSGHPEELLIYLLLVRILRLADQRSQQC